MEEDRPPAPPAVPPRVDAVDLAGMLSDAKASGRQLTPLEQYLDANAPVPKLDRWGMPLPLSATDQDRLDRISAVLWNPVHRGRALLISGSLDTHECDALRTGAPEAYAQLRTQAEQEMLKAGPPLPSWSDGVLGILFGRPVGSVYAKQQDQQKPQRSSGANYPGKPPNPTPADRASDPSLKR